MTRLVGLDVGTSSVKGLAIDEDGAVVGVAERGYPLSTPRPGWSEQDPEDWWRGAAEVLDELERGEPAALVTAQTREGDDGAHVPAAGPGRVAPRMRSGSPRRFIHA